VVPTRHPSPPAGILARDQARAPFAPRDWLPIISGIKTFPVCFYKRPWSFSDFPLSFPRSSHC
jgi:hypothetical protein